MIRALTGIHIGPRQFELPPNMPVSDSAGKYETLKLLTARGKNIGVIGVKARKCTQAVRA